MTLDGQRVQPYRYTIIPRTLSFLTRADTVLLLRVAAGRSVWSGFLNGVGGHIEKGESPDDAARREIMEETGLNAQDLELCGAIIVDSGGQPGIGLYIFVGRALGKLLDSSPEGKPEWVLLSDLQSYDLVHDLYEIIPRAMDCYKKKSAFTALTTFDQEGFPHLRFSS